MTGWLFPLRPLQQSQSRDNLRLLPPLPSSRWSDHGPYHPGERAIYVPKLSGLPGDPNYRGPDQRGSAVMKRHWVTEWGAPQTEEALGYRMRGTTNWRDIGLQNEGHHKLKWHWVTKWGAPQTEEALGYRMRGTTNWRGIGLQNKGHHKLKGHWVTEWGTPQTEETLGYRMRGTRNWGGNGLPNEGHHKLK